jgi:hypothetical protein
MMMPASNAFLHSFGSTGLVSALLKAWLESQPMIETGLVFFRRIKADTESGCSLQVAIAYYSSDI